MPDTSRSLKRYVVLPSHGIAARTMQAAVFRQGSSTGQAQMLGAEYLDIRGEEGSRTLGDTEPKPSEHEPALGSDEFRVISQRFDDGPALVSMTDDARWALEAAHPGLRVVPVTRYYLPGLRPLRGKAMAASSAAQGQAAGQTAVLDSGRVFHDDAKQHALRGLASRASREGADVLVGVIDTGVDASHPALQGNVSTLRSLIPGTPATAGGPVDWGAGASARAGHGTHVAGIICAAPGFGGPPGVAPRASVASYRIFPDNPDGPKPAENFVIIDAIRAAIEDGCHVINLSIEGASLKEDGVRSAISDAWNQGVICIAAAGNGWGLPVSYPAALPHCIAVTALGREGSFPPRPEFQLHVSNERSGADPAVFLAAFSNFGPRVQFIAPGHAIVSTFPQGQWWFDSGTSMAAPFVSGIMARALSDTPTVLNMFGDAQRSTAMIQLLVGRASLLRMPQRTHEGYGMPL